MAALASLEAHPTDLNPVISFMGPIHCVWI